jgi:hypothetical protein
MESNDYVKQTNIRLVQTITWAILYSYRKGLSEQTEPTNIGSMAIKTHTVLLSVCVLPNIYNERMESNDYDNWAPHIRLVLGIT